MNPRFNSDNSLAHRVCNSIYDIKLVLEKTKDLQITYALLDDLLGKATKELTDAELEQYSMQNLYRGTLEIRKGETLNSIINDDNERDLYKLNVPNLKIDQEPFRG